MYVVKEPGHMARFFEGSEETMIASCLSSMMGEILVTDPDCPESACAHLGDFYFFGGKADEAFLAAWEEQYRLERRGDFVILVPLGKDWEKCMDSLEDFERGERYAIRKRVLFDCGKLKELSEELPEGVKLCLIDGALYDKCLREDWSGDFVRSYKNKEDFLKKGLGVVALKDGEILAGCSSYSSYPEGVELEVDTRTDQRRKHLATACGAAMILECLKRNLYPSWDAMNKESVALSEKLGYAFSHAYPVYMTRPEKEVKKK